MAGLRAAVATAPDVAATQRRELLHAELARIGQKLATVWSIRQLLVFGSVAAGNVHEWSDLDLLVVQETDARFLERSRHLTALTHPLVGTQFFVYTPDELNAMATRPFVREEMLQKGKVFPMHPESDSARWLTFANDDVRMARLAKGEEIWSQVCFHAQQAVETCLKAMLARTGQLLPRTHVIVDLWRAQTIDTQRTLADLEARLIALDRFYIPTRYPDALPGILADGLPNSSDAHEALAAAEECLLRIRAATRTTDAG